MAASINEGDLKKIWSQLPALRISEGHHTKSPGNSPFKLDTRQVKPWNKFTRTVIKTVRAGSRSPNLCGPAKVPTESFFVANEIGVQGRFCQHIGTAMSSIFANAGMDVSFADFQYGESANKEEKTGKGNQSQDQVPDLVMALTSNNRIQIVGEMKTPWTFKKPRKLSQEQFLATKFGQIGRYMNVHNCRYGFMSTYNETWFLKRVDEYHFAASKAVEWGAWATQNGPSLKECFLHLAIMALDEERARSPFSCGLELTKKGYNLPKNFKPAETVDSNDSSDEERDDEKRDDEKRDDEKRDDEEMENVD